RPARPLLSAQPAKLPCMLHSTQPIKTVASPRSAHRSRDSTQGRGPPAPRGGFPAAARDRSYGEKRMRWKTLCWGVALLLAGAGGCKQRCFVPEGDFNVAQPSAMVSLKNEAKPALGCPPVIPPVPQPPSLANLDRKVRFISLAE